MFLIDCARFPGSGTTVDLTKVIVVNEEMDLMSRIFQLTLSEYGSHNCLFNLPTGPPLKLMIISSLGKAVLAFNNPFRMLLLEYGRHEFHSKPYTPFPFLLVEPSFSVKGNQKIIDMPDRHWLFPCHL